MELEELKQAYRKALGLYQQESERILALQNQLQMEVDNYDNKVQEVHDEDKKMLQDFLEWQKIIGLDLKFCKSGKKLTERAINDLIRQQVSLTGT